jgi:hypothetical protein
VVRLMMFKLRLVDQEVEEDTTVLAALEIHHQ